MFVYCALENGSSPDAVGLLKSLTTEAAPV
jgi:hypothetical protein